MELTVLPMKIKVFVVKNYNELYNKVEAELTKRYADAIKMYTEKYNEAKELITKKYNEIIVIITPTLKEVKFVVDWAATEISETGIFVYRYYKQYETEATKVAMQYYGQAEKLAKDYYGQARKYSAQAQKSAQVYAKKAGHGMLRGIHSSLVYLDQMDTGKMTKNMKAKMDAIMDAATAYFKSLSKYITIDGVNMEIIISIPHGGLLKPSFSQTYKAVETAVIKSVDTLKA